MKKFNYSPLYLILSCLFSSALLAQGDVEPNDNFNQAGPAALSAGISGTFPDRRDDDVYAFTVDQSGVVAFRIAHLTAGVTINMTLYDVKGNFLESSGSSRTGAFMDELICGPGTYYLWVNPVYGNVINAAYNIATSFNTKDVYECNGNTGTAALIPLESTISAQLLDEEDKDVYVFEITEPSVIGFKATVPEGVGATMTLYDAAGNHLEATGNFYNGTYMDELLCEPGFYYLWVDQLYGKPVDELYSIEVSFNTKDVYECNGDSDNAALIPLGSTINAQLLDEEDKDVYVFEITEPGVIGFKATVPEGVGATMTLYDAAGNHLEATGNFYNGTYMDELLCEPGFYYLWVDQLYGKPVDELYSIEVSFNTKDVYECNGNSDNAALIPLGSTINAQLLDEEDKDVYVFEIIEPGVIGFKATVPEGVGATMTLYDAAGNHLEATGNFYNGTYMDELLCEPGFYYLWVDQLYGKPVDELYSIEVSFNTKDVYECNQDLAEAAKVSIHSTIEAQLLDEEDVDVYVFEVLDHGVVTFHLTLPDGISANMILYNSDGDFLESTGTFSKTGYMDQLLNEVGHYYLRVKQIYGKAVDEMYSLTIGYDTDDPFEPNGTFEDAVPFVRNCDAATGQLFDEGDVDFFMFFVDENETYRLSAEKVPANAKLTFTIYDEDRSVIRSYTGSTNATFAINYTAPSSGTRFLKITSNRSSADDYIVSIADAECLLDESSPKGTLEHLWRSGSQSEWLSSQQIRFPHGTFFVCADGSTASQFVFHFDDPGAYKLEDLGLRMAEDPTGKDTDLFGTFTEISVVQQEIRAVYQHPEHLVSNDLLYNTYGIELYDKSGNTTIATYELGVYRAPVLLVHGLFSDGDAFEKMEDHLEQVGTYRDAQIKRLDYRESNTAGFTENKAVIPGGLDELFTDLVKHKIAAGKADIVGHSMGGLLPRLYIQGSDYREDVRKLITCNTPHFGSQLANLLLDPRMSCYTEVYCGDDPVGKACFGGAIVDLQVWSEAMQLVNSGNSAGVAVHAVTTVQDPQVVGLSWDRPSDRVKNTRLRNMLDAVLELIKLLGAQRFKLEIYDLYNLDQHDIVVSEASQRGGLFIRDHFTRIEDQWHIASVKNPEVIKAVAELLDQDPNGPSFTKDGFGYPPSGFGYKYKPLFACSEYEIPLNLEFIEPQEDEIFAGGEDMVIKIRSTDKNVKRIIVTAEDAVDAFGEVATLPVDFDEISCTYSVPFAGEGFRRLKAYGLDALGEHIATGESSYLLVQDLGPALQDQPQATAETPLNQLANQRIGYFDRSHDNSPSNLPVLKNLSVYPTPTKGDVSIRFLAQEEQQNATLLIFDTFGKQVYRQSIDIYRGENHLQLAVRQLPPGLYRVSLAHEKGTVATKLLRQ